MGKPGKPMAKDFNSKFTTRNNKQDIFSKISKVSKLKADTKIQTSDLDKDDTHQ